MNFRTNLTKLSLLGNVPIQIQFHNDIITFVPPNVKTYYSDLEFLDFKVLLNTTPKEFNDHVRSWKTEDQYDVLMAMLKLDIKKDIILSNLKKLFPTLEYKEDRLWSQTRPIESEEYDILILHLKISCGEMPISELERETMSNKVEDELKKKIEENEQRIRDIKNKSKKKEDKKEDVGKAIPIDQIVIAIAYEFNFDLNRIYEMNMFTLFELWSYITKIVDNQIQVVAAGNGLTKKFTYFIN